MVLRKTNTMHKVTIFGNLLNTTHIPELFSEVSFSKKMILDIHILSILTKEIPFVYGPTGDYVLTNESKLDGVKVGGYFKLKPISVELVTNDFWFGRR